MGWVRSNLQQKNSVVFESKFKPPPFIKIPRFVPDHLLGSVVQIYTFTQLGRFVVHVALLLQYYYILCFLEIFLSSSQDYNTTEEKLFEIFGRYECSPFYNNISSGVQQEECSGYCHFHI